MSHLILPPELEAMRAKTDAVAGPAFPALCHVAGYGATRNLHLLVADRLRPINRWLRERGGLNRNNEPNYRVVWGWERPDVYGMGGGMNLEFFHLERWEPMERWFTEDEWITNEMKLADELGTGYRMLPFPRRGDYLAVERPCLWAIPDRNGRRVAHFRWPDTPANPGSDLLWYQGAFINNQIRLRLSRKQVAEKVAASQAVADAEVREETQRIQDSFGIRELTEDEAHFLIRNPTLRNEPELMLSPAVSYKRTRHRIASTLN